jgi:hypothetical protein
MQNTAKKPRQLLAGLFGEWCLLKSTLPIYRAKVIPLLEKQTHHFWKNSGGQSRKSMQLAVQR